MQTLYKLEDMIKPVLTKYPETRDSDKELALIIWEKYYHINPWSPVCRIFRNDKLPSVESIGRVRRKIQEYDETLRGSRHKEKERLEAQTDYIEYSES